MAWPGLERVINNRPIDWHLTARHYDQMVKYATALRLGTAEAEQVQRRFTKGGPKRPLPGAGRTWPRRPYDLRLRLPDRHGERVSRQLLRDRKGRSALRESRWARVPGRRGAGRAGAGRQGCPGSVAGSGRRAGRRGRLTSCRGGG